MGSTSDFVILSSIRDELESMKVLGACLEVNYFGTASPTDHTFHNTDRLMREAGFDLFGLTVRPYSVAALPARYALNMPAQSLVGRPLQGDALYFRDLCAPHNWGLALTMGPEKIAKLAALFAMTGLPDHAAELLIKFRRRLAGLFDVESGLELLAAQLQELAPINEPPLRYRDYMAAFKRDDRRFYPTVFPPCSPDAVESPQIKVDTQSQRQNMHRAASQVRQRSRWARFAGAAFRRNV